MAHYYIEHGWQQGEKVRSIFQENHWEMVETVRDYGDNEARHFRFLEEVMKYYRRALYDQFVHFYNTISDDGSSEARIREKLAGLYVERVKKFRQIGRKEEQIHQLLQLFYG